MIRKPIGSADSVNEIRQQIINNLKVLRVSEQSTVRVLSVVDNMPGREHALGALKFLTQITDKKSKRENYYTYSNYLAEYFCTISNLGLFAVAFYYEDYTTLLAATFSALSHAIPSQRLHDLDLLGVFLIFGKAIANYKTIMERPDALIWGAGAMTINVMDTLLTRKYLDKIGPALHVVWHLAAALALYKFNEAQTEISTAEMESICLAAQTSVIPDFLHASYNTISEYMSEIASTSNCVIF